MTNADQDVLVYLDLLTTLCCVPDRWPQLRSVIGPVQKWWQSAAVSTRGGGGGAPLVPDEFGWVVGCDYRESPPQATRCATRSVGNGCYAGRAWSKSAVSAPTWAASGRYPSAAKNPDGYRATETFPIHGDHATAISPSTIGLPQVRQTVRCFLSRCRRGVRSKAKLA